MHIEFLKEYSNPNDGIMNNFNTTIIDSFYKNPKEISDIALSLDYFLSENGTFPGKRTRNLKDIDNDLYYYCCNQFLYSYFDLARDQVSWDIDTYFQLISPFHNDPNNIANQGWIHTDKAILLAGVVYLTPDADPNSGTSFYKKTSHEVDNYIDERREFHKTGIINDEYFPAWIKHESNFEKTLTVNNYYNRLVSYDGNVYHKANNHHAGKPRLTQTFFVKNLHLKATPTIQRMNVMPSLFEYRQQRNKK